VLECGAGAAGGGLRLACICRHGLRVQAVYYPMDFAGHGIVVALKGQGRATWRRATGQDGAAS
jgi:ABC-type xylose transport system substrate-binding protein